MIDTTWDKKGTSTIWIISSKKLNRGSSVSGPFVDLVSKRSSLGESPLEGLKPSVIASPRKPFSGTVTMEFFSKYYSQVIGIIIVHAF